MTDLTYGVLRWRNRLDFILSHHSKRPLERIDAAALIALRLGAYQLAFSSRVPQHAAVDESVRLASSYGSRKAAPFVNAVLRHIAREPETPRLPGRDAPVAYLMTTLSHPRWLARRYLERLGLEDAEARCKIHNEPPPLYVRVTAGASVSEVRARLDSHGVGSELVDDVPRALRITDGGLRDSPPFLEGLVYIQDAGAQLVAQIVAPEPGAVVLDMCAAPGGKSLSLADQVGPAGSVIALDRRPPRAALVRTMTTRHRVRNVHVAVADAGSLPLAAKFERVLLDAPCSSIGTLQRNPDIKWRVVPDDLAAHNRAQLTLLREGAGRLTGNGRLIYATCSSEPEENEDVVSAFLEGNPGFEVEPQEGRFARADGAIQTRPERDRMDGYFACVLRRDGSAKIRA